MMQGRLTLQSGKPIMDAADLTASTVYYTPFTGNKIQQWSGSAFAPQSFGEMSLSLSGMVAGALYDVFHDNGVLYLGTAWSSLTARAVAISMVDGVWCDASYRAYLGTVYCTANGQTKWQPRPTPIFNGCNNVLGVWNAHNRVQVHAINRDLRTDWSYANSGIRMADNSNKFRVTWIDGLGQTTCRGKYQSSIAGAGESPAAATVGVVLDGEYPLHWPTALLPQGAMNNTATGMDIRGEDFVFGKLGRSHWQAAEQSTSVPIMFYGNNFSALTVDLDM